MVIILYPFRAFREKKMPWRFWIDWGLQGFKRLGGNGISGEGSNLLVIILMPAQEPWSQGCPVLDLKNSLIKSCSVHLTKREMTKSNFHLMFSFWESSSLLLSSAAEQRSNLTLTSSPDKLNTNWLHWVQYPTTLQHAWQSLASIWHSSRSIMLAFLLVGEEGETHTHDPTILTLFS